MNNSNYINNENDVTHKSFLTHKQTFMELLKGFVREDWVNEVSEDNLSLENQSFILYVNLTLNSLSNSNDGYIKYRTGMSLISGMKSYQR